MSDSKSHQKVPLTGSAAALEWSPFPLLGYTETPAKSTHAHTLLTRVRKQRPKRTLSRTSASKFLSAATFTHTHPSFSPAVGTLYVALGTAETTTSEIARHRARSNEGGTARTTWRGWYARRAAAARPLSPPEEESDAAGAAGRLVYSCIESISTEKTRAPSFARRAASGRPTTSDLVVGRARPNDGHGGGRRTC